MGCRPGLKLCLLITSIIFILLIIASTILFFVVLKPKEPKITTKSVTLDRIDYSIFPKPYLNLTLNLVVEVENPNYGSFLYDDSNAYLIYRGELVGVSPIPAGYSKARSTEVIRSNVTLMTGKFLEDGDFYTDLIAGVMEFTSTSSLHGKASMFKILKAEITSNCTCEISVHVSTQKTESTCKTVVDR
ncbi:Late embryogenesis abundant protein At1g64065 [Linum grandiflorum]